MHHDEGVRVAGERRDTAGLIGKERDPLRTR